MSGIDDVEYTPWGAETALARTSGTPSLAVSSSRERFGADAAGGSTKFKRDPEISLTARGDAESSSQDVEAMRRELDVLRQVVRQGQYPPPVYEKDPGK